MSESPKPGITPADQQVLDRIRQRTRRSFLAAGATLAAAGAAFRYFDRGGPIGLLHRPFRAAEHVNELLAEHVIGETGRTAVYPQSQALRNPRPNGTIGIRRDLDLATYRLQVTGIANPHRHSQFTDDVTAWEYRYGDSFLEAALRLDGETPSGDSNKLSGDSAKINPTLGLPAAPGVLLTLADLQALPFVEQTTEFKCIEGWSELVSFGGVRFRDFLEAYPPQRHPDGSLPAYAVMTTADGTYFSGYEMAALLHPQTLLSFQMSGRDLLPAHGAPLRLAMPVKYGYKQIKQVARITYTDTKPRDFWAELGFDWHGGL